MSDERFNPTALIAAMCCHRARFVAIGGWAAGVHGVAWSTFDLDLVIACDDDNYAALQAALTEIEAVFDTEHTIPIRPDVSRLRSARPDGALLFRTKHGRLDLLKGTGDDNYETLVADAVEVDVAGCTVITASLAAIARMKRHANRPKDREVLPRIEAALLASKESGTPDG